MSHSPASIARFLLMKFFLPTFLSAMSLLSGADFFPLGFGNSWTLQAANGSRLEINTAYNFLQSGGEAYYRVNGFNPERAWIRTNDQGDLILLDLENESTVLLRSFNRERGTYRVRIGTCDHYAEVSEKRVEWGEQGRTLPALHILYEGLCPDNSLAEELYVANLGLVRRVVNTIAGPVTYNLTEAKVGNLIYVSQQGAFFDLSIPTTHWIPEDGKITIPAQLRLVSRGSEPILLRFNSGQRYEFTLYDQAGQAVWRWSDGRFFTYGVGEESLLQKTWPEMLEIPAPRPGSYVLEGKLTNSPGGAYATSVTIRID